MNSAALISLLGTGGISVIVAAIAAGMFSKRKLGAEATEIITKAAAGVVTNLQGEIERQIKRYDDLAASHRLQVKALCDSHMEEMNDVRRVLQLHAAWDALTVAKMADVGVELPPPPPLLPAMKPAHPQF